MDCSSLNTLVKALGIVFNHFGKYKHQNSFISYICMNRNFSAMGSPAAWWRQERVFWTGLGPCCFSLLLSKGQSRRQNLHFFRGVLEKQCKNSGGFSDSNGPNLLGEQGRRMPAPWPHSCWVSRCSCGSAAAQNLSSNLQGHGGSHRRSGFGFHVIVTPPTASTSAAPLGGQQGCPLVVCSNSGAQR